MVYFGEVLGKHSEVFTDDVYENCNVLPVEDGDIEVLERLLGRGTVFGYNPFDYIEEDEDYSHLKKYL